MRTCAHVIKTLVAVWATAALFCGCNTTSQTQPADDTVVHINVPVRDGAHSLPLSAVADSLHYIPLETRDDALVGQIDKLIPLKDRLIIVDKEKSRSIYLYDLQGHLLRKIQRSGRSEKEYISLTDVSVDPESQRIFIWDSPGRKVLIYSFDGVFIAAHHFPYSVQSIAYTGNNTLACYCGYSGNTRFLEQAQYPNLLFWNLQSDTIRPACYFDEVLSVSNITGILNNFSTDANGTVVLIPLNDTLYQATGTEIAPKYHIDFGEEQPRLLQQYKDHLINYDLPRSVDEFDQASPCLLLNFITSRDLVYLFFKKRQTYYYGFYYPASGRFIEASTVYDERTGGNRIPITNDLDGCTLPFMPIAADGMNHFYYTIDPYLLDYFKETSDTTLLRLQRQVSANDNPIVVRVSMKSE